MRRLLLLGVVILAGCGGTSARSDEDTIRAWSTAINANENDHAADLFAKDAKVVQGDEIVLRTHADAVRWNDLLPCAGKIETIRARGKSYLVVFELAKRPRHRCDAPGEEAAALFRVSGGKITLWHQTNVPNGGAPAI